METKYYINDVQVSLTDFYIEVDNTPVLFYTIEDVMNADDDGCYHRYFYNNSN